MRALLPAGTGRLWKEERAFRMTSSCHQLLVSKDRADVNSYLQSFLFFPAKRPLLLGQHLAASPAAGWPGHRFITENAPQSPPEGAARERPPRVPPRGDLHRLGLGPGRHLLQSWP